VNGEQRLLIVSNRLPITTEIVNGEVVLSDASGGLATGLGAGTNDPPAHGSVGPASHRVFPSNNVQLSIGSSRPVASSPFISHVRRSETTTTISRTAVLWPVFHYLLDRLPLGPTAWDSYRGVNERFADSIADHYQRGDLIWVHDYQLMLVPGLLRRKLPDARVGFFLHIPFPASEIFRTLPWRR
jgi:trehalose 6-phosphate synthase/phosphatase